MLIRHYKGNTPTFTFTADFHELVRGDLISGHGILRYDPFRIVPPEEVATLPAVQRPVVAECRFHPSGELWSEHLLFPKARRLQADWDPTGQGTMLEAEIPIPPGATAFEFWFSYQDAHGEIRYDSEMGKNFFLRFASLDLKIESASQATRGEGGVFTLSVLSLPEVEDITVRWRLTALPQVARQKTALISNSISGDRKRWTLPAGSLLMDAKSPIAFDLVYSVGGHSFTDDNEGTWYVVAPQSS
ncbi:DUF6209 family protein [Silvibacterium sp.]|uniref:DUF6209 family protein n=1 Tax=Silvibacterium sp. TaxID=1964179 RepID=UPI0039E234FA